MSEIYTSEGLSTPYLYGETDADFRKVVAYLAELKDASQVILCTHYELLRDFPTWLAKTQVWDEPVLIPKYIPYAAGVILNLNQETCERFWPEIHDHVFSFA